MRSRSNAAGGDSSSSQALAGDEELLDRVIGMRKLHETAKELAADESSA